MSDNDVEQVQRKFIVDTFKSSFAFSRRERRRHLSLQLRLLVLLTGLFLNACQTTDKPAEPAGWQEPAQSGRKITVAAGDPQVVSIRYRDEFAGWQEHVRFSHAQVIVTALIDRYFLISQLGQEKTEMKKMYQSLLAKGFEIDKFQSGTQRSEPEFYGIIRSANTSCVLFRRYTTHPDSSQGYLQSDERRTAKIDGFLCVSDVSKSIPMLIASARELMSRISFR